MGARIGTWRDHGCTLGCPVGDITRKLGGNLARRTGKRAGNGAGRRMVALVFYSWGIGIGYGCKCGHTIGLTVGEGVGGRRREHILLCVIGWYGASGWEVACLSGGSTQQQGFMCEQSILETWFLGGIGDLRDLNPENMVCGKEGVI